MTTTDTVASLVQRLRDDAAEWLILCEQRYAGEGESFPPVAIARRWRLALERADSDMDELEAIVRDAEVEARRHDVAFFTFSNDLRTAHAELLKAKAREADVR